MSRGCTCTIRRSLAAHRAYARWSRRRAPADRADAARATRSQDVEHFWGEGAQSRMLKPLRALLLPLSLGFAVGACSDDAAKGTEERGALVKVDPVGSLDEDAV